MKGGLGNLMKQAQKMQEDMLKAQEKLAQEEVTGEAGGGLVKVVLNGKHEVRRVSIDDSLMGDARHAPGQSRCVAYVTLSGGANVTGSFAGGGSAVMASLAGAGCLCVIEKRRGEVTRGVTIVASSIGANVIRRLTFST